MAELTYKNACIMYLEQNMECVGYRDYIIKQLNKLEQIEDIVRDYYNEQYTDKLDIEIIEMISEVLEEDGRWED